MMYSVLAFLGSLVVYFGINFRIFRLIILGRIMVGIGGEGIRIVQLTVNELWFFGHFLSASVAWSEIFENLADSFGNMLHPEFLLKFRSLNAPFFFMCLMTCFSAVASILYYFQHVKYQQILKDRESEDSDNHTTSSVINISQKMTTL